MFVGFDEMDIFVVGDADHVDVEVQRIVNEDKFCGCAAYEIKWI